MNQIVFTCRLAAALAVGALVSGCAKDRPVRVYEPIPHSGVIDTKVQSLLTADPLLKGQSIKVYSFQGDVKLDGVVQSEQQREQAAKLAWGVPGVRSVENNILLTSER
jgi:hyperosmotically inducible protein